MCRVSFKPQPTGQTVRAPLAGRPTQELAGDRPKHRRAPTQELDRPLSYFLTLSGSSVCALPLRVTCPRSLTQLVVRRWPGWTSSGTGFANDGSYGLRAVFEHCLPCRGRVGDRRVEEPCHGTERGASPGRAAVGARFQSPTQIDMVVCGWACAHVLRFGAAPVGMHYPMIRMAGGVCKAVAQELSDDRMA